MTVSTFVLFAAAVTGGTVLAWRRLAAGGFGIGQVNQPLIVASPLRNLSLRLVGAVLLLAPAVGLWRSLGWQASVLGVILGVGLGVIVARLLARHELTRAKIDLEAFDAQYGHLDALTATMKFHLEQGSITQEQFQEFLERTRGLLGEARPDKGVDPISEREA